MDCGSALAEAEVEYEDKNQTQLTLVLGDLKI
jgi:isoleucyl-tRNA synthetase